MGLVTYIFPNASNIKRVPVRAFKWLKRLNTGDPTPNTSRRLGDCLIGSRPGPEKNANALTGLVVHRAPAAGARQPTGTSPNYRGAVITGVAERTSAFCPR